jgi:hypothetical protein
MFSVEIKIDDLNNIYDILCPRYDLHSNRDELVNFSRKKLDFKKSSSSDNYLIFQLDKVVSFLLERNKDFKNLWGPSIKENEYFIAWHGGPSMMRVWDAKKYTNFARLIIKNTPKDFKTNQEKEIEKRVNKEIEKKVQEEKRKTEEYIRKISNTNFYEEKYENSKSYRDIYIENLENVSDRLRKERERELDLLDDYIENLENVSDRLRKERERELDLLDDSYDSWTIIFGKK